MGFNQHDVHFWALQLEVLGHREAPPAAADNDGSGPFRLRQVRLLIDDERSRAHGRPLLGTVIRRVLGRGATVGLGTQAHLARPAKHASGGHACNRALRPPQKITT